MMNNGFAIIKFEKSTHNDFYGSYSLIEMSFLLVDTTINQVLLDYRYTCRCYNEIIHIIYITAYCSAGNKTVSQINVLTDKSTS